jgi:phosphoribosylformylglycinamidine synthase subunit PurQ / glutaminase
MTRPNAVVLSAPGTNRAADVAFALETAGASPRTVLLTDLVDEPGVVDTAQLVVVAGGFSFGDALGAGRLFALELERILGDALTRAIERGVPVIGICNGFQALVRLGILPGAGLRAALGHNDAGTFDCRWVRLAPRSSLSVWTNGLTDEIECPIAHGEGRFTCDDATWEALVAGDRIALTYASENPNGSRGDVAGICDASGLVLGLMPHPENHVVVRQHPLHRQRDTRPGLGLRLFERGVAHVAS